MHNQRTFLILIVYGLILQNVDSVEGYPLLDSIFAAASDIVDSVLKAPKSIIDSVLEITGPLTAPVDKTLKGIVDTAGKGSPLNQTQVKDLLKILNVSSISELKEGNREKISKVLNLTEILKTEEEILMTTAKPLCDK